MNVFVYSPNAVFFNDGCVQGNKLFSQTTNSVQVCLVVDVYPPPFHTGKPANNSDKIGRPHNMIHKRSFFFFFHFAVVLVECSTVSLKKLPLGLLQNRIYFKCCKTDEFM